ncbi:MAG: PEGA domain-containing protein [Myxococcota bacterium]
MRPLTDLAPGTPAPLISIIERCLQKQARQRFETTHKLIAALDAYIQKNVKIDPRSRLLLFLRNRQLITEEEAAVQVPPTLLKEASVRRLDAGIPLPAAALMLRPVGIAHAVLVAVIAVFVLMTAIQRPTPDVSELEDPTLSPAARRIVTPPNGEAAAKKAATKDTAAKTGQHGFLRVVAQPWAEVYVDGKFKKTTPFDEPIKLAPGSYRVRLRNPRYEPEDRMVDIRPGDTFKVNATLTPKAEGKSK